MTNDAAEADRRREVREAARGWRRASAIGDASLQAIREAYPDDRVRLGPAFRSLAFVFTALGLNAVFFFVMALFEPPDRVGGWLALAFGIALCMLTDVQVRVWKRCDGGTETATAGVGLGYVLGAAGWLLSDSGLRDGAVFTTVIALAALLGAAAARRWGMPIFAAIAALSFFVLLGRSPYGRVLWIVGAATLTPLLLRHADSVRLPPTHRQSIHVVLAIALVAVYAALNLWSWDHKLIEWIAGGPEPDMRASPLRPLAIVGTAVVPLSLVAFGIRSRRRLFLDLGVLLAVVSLVTLRAYVHVAPAWVVLTASGGAAVAAALALRRFLASGTDAERNGFTAEPLFEDVSRQGALETAAALASTPHARPAPAEERGFTPGGGGFGGGGGSGEY